MTIHAATIKSAQAKGLTIAETEVDGTAYLVIGSTNGTRMWNQPADDQEAPGFIKAVLAALKYEEEGFEGIEENEAVVISQADASGEDFIATLMIGGKPAGQLARDPMLSDLLDTLNDEEETQAQITGIREDAAGEDEGEEERTGSVVPDVFKKRYAEAGHPGHCGDWLATTLNSLCQTLDGKKTITDLDRLEAIANANDVAPARVDKLGTATNGWQGRYRMTVRNMLAKKVADKGFLFIPEGCGVKKDEERQAPKDWCERFKTVTKAKKVVAKDEGAGKSTPASKAKAEAKAEAKALPTPAEPAKGFNGRPAKVKGTKADKAAVKK